MAVGMLDYSESSSLSREQERSITVHADKGCRDGYYWPIFLDNRATFFFATLFPLFNSELSCSTAFEEFLIPIII